MSTSKRATVIWADRWAVVNRGPPEPRPRYGKGCALSRLRSFLRRHAVLVGVLVCLAWIIAVVVMIAVDPGTSGGGPG
ncbi:hypothetical protein AB0I28_30435 [Phytomonospora sp. NPDC050363]|uniref:hypothetical protein n=1 Tax=Phytomonospora sp. NPDC050363 TaxID=3155642 RepID=UPI0033CB2F62